MTGSVKLNYEKRHSSQIGYNKIKMCLKGVFVYCVRNATVLYRYYIRNPNLWKDLGSPVIAGFF